MNEAWKNGKKTLILGLILVCLPQSWAQIFFSVISRWRIVKHYSKLLSYKIKKTLMNKAWEKKKKINFGLHFGLFTPNFSPPEFFHEFYLYE